MQYLKRVLYLISLLLLNNKKTSVIKITLKNGCVHETSWLTIIPIPMG